MALLEVNGLQTFFKTERGVVRAVDGVSFSLEKGRTLAVVGESGSGKSVCAMSILRLLDANGYIAGGSVSFTVDGRQEDLTKLPEEKLYAVRGNRISVVFQEPMTSLNPVHSIKRQLSEPFRIHRNMGKKEAEKEALAMLKAVQIPSPERVIRQYPHQLSGGMRQRVMIAMALACRPDILIADEPMTALDVTVQAQILSLMKSLQREHGTAILFITHDLGVVGQMADDVVVTYCGQAVEQCEARFLFSRSAYLHPYTEGLIASVPRMEKRRDRLESISGSVPHPLELPKGCRFAPRCKYRTEKCIAESPDLFEVAKGRKIRCFYPKKEERRSEQHQKLIVRHPS